MIIRPVRVRFAPSPTGPLHIGGMRTALFNYLFARKHKGTFVLRIEDTDQKRLVKSAEQYIVESLKWSGINPDESVINGGKFGPYRQSERGEFYRENIDKLVKSGHAYYAFDKPEELERLRKEKEREGITFTYNNEMRNSLSNSLNFSGQEVEKRLNSGEPYVIRFMIPANERLKFNDLVRGNIEVDTSTLDDKILFKSDGMPTYHLANVVDDHLMQITHVIRGEEWLPSLPLHILLYRAFNWESPGFAHMPLTLKPDGKGKLSKRDGDRLGFPVFPLEWKNPETGEISSGYREAGYFPEAFVNILAFLGWNPGTTQEIFSMDELIEAFSLERIVKAGSRFDPEKAKWFNQQYLRRKENRELAELFVPILETKGINITIDYVTQVCDLVKERATFVSEMWDHSYFFFIPPERYDEKIIRKRWNDESESMMNRLGEILKEIEPFTSENIEEKVKKWINLNSHNMGQVLNLCRLLMVGASAGPHLFDILSLIGKRETLSRISRGIEKIGVG